MRTFKKTCKDCGKEFTATGPRTLYCDNCIEYKTCPCGKEITKKKFPVSDVDTPHYCSNKCQLDDANFAFKHERNLVIALREGLRDDLISCLNEVYGQVIPADPFSKIKFIKTVLATEGDATVITDRYQAKVENGDLVRLNVNFHIKELKIKFSTLSVWVHSSVNIRCGFHLVFDKNFKLISPSDGLKPEDQEIYDRSASIVLAGLTEEFAKPFMTRKFSEDAPKIKGFAK